MWAKTLDRARRRLRMAVEPPVPAPTVQDGPPPATEDLVLALTRAEQLAFVTSLEASIGGGPSRLDSPARLAGGLSRLIERARGCGRVTVTRSPAGLYTPEYWHIRVDGADAATRGELERLAGGRRFE